jgi:hypothetical protein
VIEHRIGGQLFSVLLIICCVLLLMVLIYKLSNTTVLPKKNGNVITNHTSTSFRRMNFETRQIRKTEKAQL